MTRENGGMLWHRKNRDDDGKGVYWKVVEHPQQPERMIIKKKKGQANRQ